MSKRFIKELKKFADDMNKSKSSGKLLADLDFSYHSLCALQKEQPLDSVIIPEVDKYNFSYHCDKDSGLIICKEN